MDLSRLKWPLIILVVALAIFLITDAGVAFMFGRFTKQAPGEDPEVDALNEAGLTRLGGLLIKTFRYKKAEEVLQTTVQRFPEGKNYWLNLYRLAKCAEKLGDYDRSVTILEDLIQNDANSKDDRVPGYEVLRLRADKLIEVHELRDR